VHHYYFISYLLWLGNECYRLTHPLSKISGNGYAGAGAAMSICEAMSEAQRERKYWGSPATIMVDHDDECSSVCCTDAVSGSRIVLSDLQLVDSYDEVYLLAMALDFTRT